MSDSNIPDIGTDAYNQCIRQHAYRLWEQDGRPHGQDIEFWERARELVGMLSNPTAGQMPNPVPPGADRPFNKPPVDEAILEENLGEMPGRLTDQGDRAQAPVVPAKKRRLSAGNLGSAPTT